MTMETRDSPTRMKPNIVIRRRGDEGTRSPSPTVLKEVKKK